ncbi:MAG: SpoIIE family protein phosphatase [Gammaproteobacteria bacterium]|nr:SpoIIE family protein phosphatase [Gammaproteobacteria bacterium]
MSIVVMDDDEANAASLVQRLNELGYAAMRGRGTPLPVNDPIELFVCGFHGRDALAAMVQPFAARLDRLPAVLACAGTPAAEDLAAAMALGFTDILPWPGADDDTLVAVLERNIRRSRARRANDPNLFRELGELERDQRAGRYIQMGMLPPNPMALDHYRLRHRIHPSLLLSGDFVDYFRITDEHFVFYIADVSGHGASSAFVTVILKNFSRRLRREYRPSMLREPGEILVALNREILDNRIDKHVAMFLGVVNMRTNALRYANAGHFPHAIRVRDGHARLLELSGKPVGLFQDVSYESAGVELAEGDNLVLLSDGVLEVIPEAGLADKEHRIEEAAVECGADFDRLWSALGVDSAAAGPDDMTCLMVACGA